nr:hypothetical protein CFP56_25916 [Quercus suber]
MKSAIAASTLVVLAAAQPPSFFGGPFAGSASCFSDCARPSASSFSDLCSDASAIDTVNNCISSSSCSDDEKSNTYQAIAQWCANAGVTVTASPEATFSATSGATSWPSGWSTVSGDPFGGPWGGAGWNGADGHGPFGDGAANGWGPWAGQSTGSWTAGPWTSWWGDNACPPSTWPGWTSGSWSTSAPWTSWPGCTATATASSVITTTVTTGGATSTITSTSLGFQIAAVTPSDGSSTTPNGAMPTNFMMAGSAAGAVGVLAGALLLHDFSALCQVLAQDCLDIKWEHHRCLPAENDDRISMILDTFAAARCAADHCGS